MKQYWLQINRDIKEVSKRKYMEMERDCGFAQDDELSDEPSTIAFQGWTDEGYVEGWIMESQRA